MGRAEVLTQLARVEGARDRFDEGDALLDEAASLAGSTPLVRARIDLERGRLRRSAGDPEAALPLFEPRSRPLSRSRTSSSRSTPRTWRPSPRRTIETRLAWANRGIEPRSPRPIPRSTSWLGLALQQRRLGLLRRRRLRDRPRLVRACARRAREAARRARRIEHAARPSRKPAACSSPPRLA